MKSFIDAVFVMDTSSLCIVVVLSVLWAYLLYETLGSWLIGVLSAPMFILTSLIANYLLEKAKFFITGDAITDVIFATCIGSISSLAATLVAVRMLMSISTANLKNKQS